MHFVRYEPKNQTPFITLSATRALRSEPRKLLTPHGHHQPACRTLKRVNRRQFITAAAAASALAAAAPQEKKPNILFILADDLGYGDLGCYGQQQIKTPNIDRLAREGVRFTQAYAGSTVCAPSRCALMTGFHTGHGRVRGNADPDLPLRPQDITVAEVLKGAGYRTAVYGKWSLGNLGSTGYPTRKGFDDWLGYFSQTHAHNYYPEHLLDNEKAIQLKGNTGTRHTDYAPDLFTARALEFLSTKSEKPFFLHICYTQPHANNEMGRDTGNGMQVPDLGSYADKPWSAVEKGFAAMITRMDSDIGKVLDKLAAIGEADNTLVIFASDNGAHKEGGHDPSVFESSGPLHGIKRDMYEGGIRVPAIMRWPRVIKPGRVSDHVWAFWDFLPTAAEIAGVRAPAGIDGISLVPLLYGRPQQQHEYLYWEFHENGFDQAIRVRDWKGVKRGRTAPLELYDLSKDVSERTNLAGQNPAVAARLGEIMSTARTESPEWPVKDKIK